MSGKVLVNISGKGGVGKTTVTANLGAALALRHNKVVLVDADIGLRNLDVVMGLEDRVVHDLSHVVRGECSIEEATISDPHISGLSLIPAPGRRDMPAMTRQEMRGLCLLLREDHDYTLIDSPAGIGEGFRNAIAPADEAIVVTNPNAAAIRNADRVIALVEELGMPIPRLIVNRARRENENHPGIPTVQEILGVLAVPCLGVVPEDEGIMLSGGWALSRNGKRRSGAEDAFHQIAARLDGEEAPEIDSPRPEGLLSHLRRFRRLARRLVRPR